MEEQKISLETCVLAYEKGYPLGRITHLNEDRSLIKYVEYTYVPTQSLLQRWLREKHDIHVSVNVRFHEKKTNGVVMYAYEISTLENYYDGIGDNLNHWLQGLGEYDPLYHTHEKYEEALEIGLQEGLKLIKEKE